MKPRNPSVHLPSDWRNLSTLCGLVITSTVRACRPRGGCPACIEALEKKRAAARKRAQ